MINHCRPFHRPRGVLSSAASSFGVPLGISPNLHATGLKVLKDLKMKIQIFLFVLGFGCLLSLAEAQTCDLKNKKQDKPFPDITKSIADSYILGVEYSVPGAEQSDYYTEYYEVLFKRGRVESHINGKNQIYIYRSETYEAWTLEDTTCSLQNITDIPQFLKDDQTDWLYYPDSDVPTTVGPSAMFKIAIDAWNNTDRKNMAYMGPIREFIRGENATFWRRCLPSGGYVDYFFAASSVENAFDSDDLRKFDPLRVVFNGVSKTEALATQVYDIISFKNFIPAGIEPVQLPKGRNCDRGSNVTVTTLPSFAGSSLYLNAEVVYQTLNKKTQAIISSYYSTLRFALDKESDHVAYYYSSWNTTKPDSKAKEVKAPEYVIYDMKHLYKYSISYENGTCQISRDESFIPEYKLPEKGGSLAITDPYVLFPNSELKFLTTGKDRGLDVNIFEAEILGYLLDNKTQIERAIVSHSYLKSNQESENTVAVKNAPTSIEFHFFREKSDVEEVLTLNIFGFTTRIPRRRNLFNVKRCFKNDDDYLLVTIGFEIDNQYLADIEKALPEIEQNVVEQITSKSELNPVRMPTVLTDFKDNYVYVTLTILGKPPLELDFPNSEKDKSIKTSGKDGDTQGVSNFDTCANNCLEENGDCWGFSLCGATCYYGSSENTVVETRKNCTLYRRYSNKTYMLSKESQAENIVKMVESKQFNVMATLAGDKRITLEATVADVTDPAEDDSMFDKMGNLLNPRMRVVKAGAKLKTGSEVKRMGKLRYDQCQSLCLDFKTCESLSYCMKKSECIISPKYEADLKPEDMENNDLCILLSRKYADNFDRTPGVFVESGSGTKKDFDNVEDCARACLKEGSFKCLSFDHCAGKDKGGCSLYKVHYLKQSERKAAVTGKSPRCGHYTRKYSTEFKRKDNTRFTGTKVDPITNLTLEECAKTCIDYGEGTCYGYDFCQDKTLYATSCTIIDKDPSRLTSSFSPICTNYARTEQAYAPHPYTNSYAGGIGFLCFVVGGVIGAVVVFVVAYIRANRGG